MNGVKCCRCIRIMLTGWHRRHGPNISGHFILASHARDKNLSSKHSENQIGVFTDVRILLHCACSFVFERQTFRSFIISSPCDFHLHLNLLIVQFLNMSPFVSRGSLNSSAVLQLTIYSCRLSHDGVFLLMENPALAWSLVWLCCCL